MENARASGVRNLKPHVVCSIGSTDPTTGAGLFLDAAAYSKMRDVAGVYVVAGITAQNSRRVRRVLAVPTIAIEAQLEAIFEQVRPDAIRIGLIPRASACMAVAAFIRTYKRRLPVVFDPVISASSGTRLVKGRSIDGLRALMRVATIVTPNAVEAGELASMRVVDVADAERAGSKLAKRYKCAVLITGGHLKTKSRIVDVLVRPDGTVKRFSAARLRADMRGTGCILAASLAAALARGYELSTAVRFARRFVRAALVSSRPLGRGRPQFRSAGVGGAAV